MPVHGRQVNNYIAFTGEGFKFILAFKESILERNPGIPVGIKAKGIEKVCADEAGLAGDSNSEFQVLSG